jgi:eukaryotic-like serine/threonine-protein kinase
MNTTRWEAISPCIDQALEIDPAERPAWIAKLRTVDANLAADVAAFLEDNALAAEEGFLEHGTLSLPSLAPRPLAGQTLGAYTLISPIGEGGMGTVWRAQRTDGRYEGTVAVKLLNAERVGHSGEARFRRETALLARVTHPHIARLIDAGVSPSGQPYLLLEHVDGTHIDRHCDDRTLSVASRLRLFQDVLAAVAHAHANLIVHRDLKPSNVLVSVAGEVKLLDFGIAKLLEGEERGGSASSLTRDGERALTPECAAPEQVTGGPITTATDVYALGVMLYLLLSGEHPYGAAPSAAERVRAIVEMEPRRLSTAAAQASGAADRAACRGTTPERLQRTLRGDLDTIVAKALKKNPEERYPSVTALGEDVRRYLEHQPIQARPDTISYRAARFVRRNRLPVALATLTLLTLLGGVGGVAWQARAAAQQRDLALAQLDRAENVNAFIMFIVGERAPGESIRVGDLLTRAERFADKRLAQDQAVAVDLLVTVGAIYFAHGENDNARRVLKRAYEASAGLWDSSIRAEAMCTWALASADGADFAPAHRLIEDALALTSEEPRFDAVAAHCLLDRAGIAMDEDAAADVTDHAARAVARLHRRPTAFPDIRVQALQMQAVGLKMQGKIADADRMFARAHEQLQLAGLEDTLAASTLFHNWAGIASFTNPLHALELYRRVLSNRAAQGPDPSLFATRYNYGVQLTRLARYPEARAMFEALREDARKLERENLGRYSRGIASTCRHLGNLGCAREALSEADEAFRVSFPAGHSVFAELSREKGLLAAAEGRTTDALRLITEAMAKRSHAREKQVVVVETLLDLARLEISVGRTMQARQHAQAALDYAEGLRGGTPRSAWVGLSQLTLGKVSQAEGDSETAQRLFADALTHMTPTLGETHPAVKEARAQLDAKR